MTLIATLIANPENADLTGELVSAAANTIDAGKMEWLAPDIACDLELPVDITNSEAVSLLQRLTGDLPIDIVVQEKAARRKKALIADMDSTMIDQECIDELAAEVGLKEKVAAITARAMNGEIEFEPALRERVALLKDLPEDIYKDVIKNRITHASGGKSLVATMRNNGAYCALVSGGFTLFTNPIAHELGFHENRANILMAANGKLIGRVAEPILGKQAKIDALTDIANRLSLKPEDFIAVGDGANDLAMLDVAGSGVALHAKLSVAEKAKIRIDHGDLTSLLYIQGYRQDEFIV